MLPLVYYGDKRLRAPCKDIEKVTKEVRLLALEMKQTMKAKNGLGLAAPQVGHQVRLFLSAFHEDQVEVFINPTLTNPSSEFEIMQEGCLSIPGLYRDVSRPKSVMVHAMDLDGKWFMREVFGLEARIIMHENDHLNGVLFIDLLSLDRPERKRLERDLSRIEEKYAIS